MAEETPDGQEKTEEPTPKRQREAKEKGQVPRSRELNTTLVMLASAFGLLMFGDYMGRGLTGLIQGNFQISRETVFDPLATMRLLETAVGQGLLILAPFAALMMVVAVGASVALGGWSFNLEGMLPKFEKLDPIKGFGRMFGLKSLIELVKSIAKVSVIGTVGYAVLVFFEDDFLLLTSESLETGIAHGIHIFFVTFFVLAAALVLVAAVDVPYQMWDLRQKLRMTKQELKEEYKQTEGKPEVKSRIRQLQQQIAMGRMMEQVPKADVVVTNPTHYAIALRYDQLKMKAPRVVAKGTDLTAARIRQIAQENRVPIFEAPPLARALYYTTNIEKEIPAGLYLAVAQVLAYIYQLRNAHRTGVRPEPPSAEVPQEFLDYLRKRGKPV